MKNFFITLKWLWLHIKSYTVALIIIVVTGIILSLLGVSIAVVSKELIDAAAARQMNNVILTSIVFIIVFMSQILIDAVNTVISTKTQDSIANSIRLKLFEKLTKSKWLEYNKYHSEDILTRMTSDVATVTNGVINVVPNMIALGAKLVAAFITLMMYEPILAILAFVLGPISVLFSRFFVKRLKLMHLKIQEAESKYRSLMHEAISNMLIVKVFCIEESTYEKIGELQNDRLNWVVKRSTLGAVSNSALAISYWAGYFLAFGWGALKLSTGAITFGTLTAFLQLAGQVQGPIVGLARSLPQLIATIASTGRLMEYDDVPQEVSEDNKIYSYNDVGVKFQNVSFGYENGNTVIKDLSIDILPEDIVVLMGASGEGKTTIVRLLLALIEPDEGNLYYYNKKGEHIPVNAVARSLISYVPQGNTLFSGTIADNLRIGNKDATENEIEAALRVACAWDFIEELPEGYYTKIGEKGLGLSEGQAQRISIARALIRKTPIIILDEATSALDVNTEMQVLKGIKKMKPARTCILISHRPAALQVCNRVIKLEDGRIYEDNLNKEVISHAG